MRVIEDFGNFRIHAFWSKEITALINDITGKYGKSYATQHDIVLKFVNDTMFLGAGEFNREFRKKGNTYPDLKILGKESNRTEIVELRLHTSELKYLRRELNERDKIFATSDYLYFTYFLQVRSKQKSKVLKARACIFYLIVIELSKNTQFIPIHELVAEIKMKSQEFSKKLANESGINEDTEELLGVENMIKVVDLEREISDLKAELIEKGKQLEERVKEIERLKARLKKK